ncbi:Uncharacterised protein [Vibrio cholerae]|nr:Uncharacterised protein [Vibrio cholerae]
MRAPVHQSCHDWLNEQETKQPPDKGFQDWPTRHYQPLTRRFVLCPYPNTATAPQ